MLYFASFGNFGTLFYCVFFGKFVFLFSNFLLKGRGFLMVVGKWEYMLFWMVGLFWAALAFSW